MSRIESYSTLDSARLANVLAAAEAQFARHIELSRARNQTLDLTRGKPSDAQLDLSDSLDGILQGNYVSADGIDTRNYGGLRGLREARELGQQLLDIPPELIMAAGNSSLQLMHQATEFARAKRWKNTQPTLVCPVPGYDRHFTVCESQGLKMLPLMLTTNGPDMDKLEAMVAADDQLGGIWCVPRFSNPTGTTYSDEVVTRLAALPKIAANKQFIIFWDNAYSVHALHDNATKLSNLMNAAQNAGTQDQVFMFASTSKITFAGSGLAFFGASAKTLDELEEFLSATTIGPDKVNQLRTVKFLEGRLQEHMAAHAKLLRPRFELVEQKLNEGLQGLDVANWTTPDGGYFVSLDCIPGLAKSIVSLTASAGGKLTAAGATWPGGVDPEDSNIRIAPTYPELEELSTALDVLVSAIKLASARHFATAATK